MRTLLLTLAFATALLLGPSRTAECWRYCGNFICANSSQCFTGCACTAPRGGGTGRCVAVQ